MAHRFTVGVEEEFQSVDPSTGELRSHVSELIAATSPGMGEQIKPKLHQSIVEIVTRIRENVEGLRGGKLIDFGKRTEVPMRDLAMELLEFVDDVIDDLGSRSAVSSIRRILEEGTSAERQLRVYRETNDLRAVVRHLVEETRAGVGGRVATAAGAS